MKAKLVVGGIVVLCFVSGVGVYAKEMKQSGKGTVGGFVNYFNQDISYLKNELDSLMSECGRE